MKGLNKYIAIGFGATVSGYGAKAVITQEIFVEGSRMRGVGWHMYGTPAVFGGALILALGLYVVWLAFTLKE